MLNFCVFRGGREEKKFKRLIYPGFLSGVTEVEPDVQVITNRGETYSGNKKNNK